MKRICYLLLSALAGGASLHAASLGDAIESSKEVVKEKAPVIASAVVENVECAISEATLCAELYLPDAFSGKRLKPSQEGQVVLFIRGKLTNKGSKKTTTDTPRFLSAEGKKYEGKDMFFHGVKSKELFITLNPDEEYDFATYFFLPVQAVIGGKLLFKNDSPFSGRSATMELNFDRSTTIHDVLTKGGITDNPFDVDDDD